MKLFFGMAIVVALLGVLGYFHYRQSNLLAGRLVRRSKGRGKDKSGAGSEGNPVYGPTNEQEVNPGNEADRA